MDLDVLHKYLPWRNCGPGCVCINIYHGGIVDLDVLHKYFTMEELWTWMCCINIYPRWPRIYHGGIVDLDVLHKYLPWRNCGPGCVA